MEDLMIKIENVSKTYKLGQIGGTTLRDELQRLHAKLHKKEDPTKRIGAKDYNKGEKFNALNGVSFEVKKGERVGIIGHNGAGKSTLLKLITRVTAPTEGVISLNGRVASMLEVGTGFHPELTGRENIYMNGAILGMTKKEIDAKIDQIIEFSEVSQFIDTPVKRYSSGMFVKLAFAVAAHLSSEIMIMDEVLAVGDMAFQKKCIDKMNQVSKEEGRTILYVSHNMNTIRQLCNRVVVLDHGKVIFNGDVEEGIGVYMGIKDDLKVEYDYSNIKRLTKNTEEVCLNKLKITDKQVAYFEQGENINMEMEFFAKEKCDNVGMRFVIKNQMDNVIGTSFSYNIFNAEKGKKYILRTVLKTKNIVPGYYFTDIVIFGKQIAMDTINKAICFEIRNDNMETLKWVSSWWGNIQIDDLETRVIKEIL